MKDTYKIIVIIAYIFALSAYVGGTLTDSRVAKLETRIEALE